MRARPFKGEKRPKQKHVLGLELPRELELDLQAYCEAMDDAPKATVLRKALSRYLQAQLDENHGIKASYEAIRSALREKESNLVPLHRVDAAKRQENSA
jgi:hypothetical protein